MVYKKYKYDDNQLREAVASSFSVAEVMRAIGMKITGGNHSYISKRINDLSIDKSHFLGKRSNFGIKRGGPDKLDLNEVFVLNRLKGRREKASILRRALIEAGVEYTCNICNINSWNNKPLTLVIDHINGNGLDNNKENLRFLCHNCHSLTDNYGAKNRK